MKKIVCLLCMLWFCGAAFETQAMPCSTNKNQEHFDKGRRTKSGRYKKKKGFMWGLFKGKNQCDCPKH